MVDVDNHSDFSDLLGLGVALHSVASVHSAADLRDQLGFCSTHNDQLLVLALCPDSFLNLFRSKRHSFLDLSILSMVGDADRKSGVGHKRKGNVLNDVYPA